MVLVATAPLALALDPAVIYLDESRTLLVGALGALPRGGVQNITTNSFQVPVDSCHVELRGSLAWDPGSYGAGAGPASVALDSSLRVRILNASGPVPGAQWDHFGGSGMFVRTVARSTLHTVEVTLTVGANVSYHIKVFGWVDPNDTSCSTTP